MGSPVINAVSQGVQLTTPHTLVEEDEEFNFWDEPVEPVSEETTTDEAAETEETTEEQQPEPECMDTDNGSTDRTGDSCDYYTRNPSGCGNWDDEDFVAN